MQIIAYLTMLVNHFTGYEWVGVALPIFCYGIVKGLSYTSNKEKYILRIIVIGLISQLFWPFKENTNMVNDLLVIGVSMLAIQETRLKICMQVIMILSYLLGVTAIEPLCLMILAKKGKKVFYIGLVVMTISWSLMYPFMLRWLFVIPVIELYEKKYLTDIIKINKYLKYSIYPIHLMILYVLR
jgi:hypothetical protein